MITKESVFIMSSLSELLENPDSGLNQMECSNREEAMRYIKGKYESADTAGDDSEQYDGEEMQRLRANSTEIRTGITRDRTDESDNGGDIKRKKIGSDDDTDEKLQRRSVLTLQLNFYIIILINFSF